MYLHLGQETVVRERDIIGIFDLDNTTVNKFTNEFLNKMQAEGKIEYLVSDIPKSFILMKDGTVFVVELSSQILKKRFE